MRFKLEIECDNAAFEDAGTEEEVARILEGVAADLLAGQLTARTGDYKALMDVNGNRVGTASFKG